MTTNPYLDEWILCCSFALWRAAPHTPQIKSTSTPNGLCNNTNGNGHSCCKIRLMRLYDQRLQYPWKFLHSPWHGNRQILRYVVRQFVCWPFFPVCLRYMINRQFLRQFFSQTKFRAVHRDALFQTLVYCSVSEEG